MQDTLEEIRDLMEAALTTSFKKYYVGNVSEARLFQAYMPVLMVYGTNTSLVSDQLTLQRDKYRYNIGER